MKTYKMKDSVAYRALGEEAVLLNPDDNQIHLLNEVACYTWELLTELRSEEDLVNLICGEFDVSADQASSDASKLLNEMNEKGLIEVLEG